jgi:YbbR domain-containing protein
MKKRRIHIVISTILIGAFLWLSTNLNEQYQITVAAPLTIEEVPAEMAVRTPVPRVVQLKFRGDGWRLAGLLLRPDIRLRVPLYSLPPGNQIITINDVLERVSLSPGVQLVGMNPDTVALLLDHRALKRVPVIPEIAVTFREGYGQVGNVMLSPESVTVSGAAALLDSIDRWPATVTRFDDVKAPVEEDVPLAESPDFLLEFSPPTVRVRINVQQFAEKVFSGLAVELHSLPSNRDVIFIPPKIEIVARGGIRQLAGILPVDFQVSVEYDRIVADTTGTIEPDINTPQGVQVVVRRPERVQYIVRKRL